MTFVLATIARASADQRDDLRLGQSVFDDIRAKHQLVTDSPYDPILQRTGARISRAAAPHWWTERFYIVRGNQMNAFSAPGGYVFVNEGLLRSVDGVAELANVLGHETAHIVLGHLTAQAKQTQMRHDIFAKVGGLFGHSGNSPSSQYTLDAAQLASNYTFLNYTRQQEYEADQRGAQLAAEAGFDPWGSIWFAREVQRLEGDAGYEAYVQHHPSMSDRIKHLQAFLKAHPATFARWSSTPPAGTGLPI
jgi:predicted Zn-dependent protease